MANRVIDVWRMSSSRPWQLQKTHNNLIKYLKFDGDIRYHLIESVLVEDLSEKCIKFGKDHGYSITVIKPAKGQGYAINEALHKVITTKYALKMEDDFMPEMDIPLDNCFDVMEEYNYINQICFNKRETMRYKKCIGNDGKPFDWPKEQRYFKLDDGREIPLVVKEKWWFGAAMWRTDFIRPIFRYWGSNTHNLFNDQVILPMAGMITTPGKRHIPTPSEIEERIGCYIYGKHGDKRMVEHTGKGDSIWAGEFQKMMRDQGKEIIGI